MKKRNIMTVINQFPVDLTGTSARNLIRNEERTMPTQETKIFVPSGGAFYADTLVLFDKDTGRRLQPLTDYKCLHLHEEGSLDSGKQVCWIIYILNNTISKIKYDYQVIGGHYNDVYPTIKSLIDNTDFEQLNKISWGTQVYGKPEVYPAAAHKHPGHEFGDWNRFHVALNNIYHAILHKDTAAWQSVYDYIDGVVSSGLSNLEPNDKYYTKEQITSVIANALLPYQTKEGASNATQSLSTIESDINAFKNAVNLLTASLSEKIAGLTTSTNNTTRELSELISSISTNLNRTISSNNSTIETKLQEHANAIAAFNNNLSNAINSFSNSSRTNNTELTTTVTNLVNEGISAFKAQQVVELTAIMNQARAANNNSAAAQDKAAALERIITNISAASDTQSRLITELNNTLANLSSSTNSSTSDLTTKINKANEEIDKINKKQFMTLSKDKGNLLELRNDGMYYGIQAPPNLSNLYVDAIGGDDNNPGTRERPFKTLDKALWVTPSALSNTIWLKYIPLEKDADVCYYLSTRYDLKAHRVINVYDDPYHETQEWRDFYNNVAHGVGYSWEYNKFHRAAIRLKPVTISHGGRQLTGISGFYLNDVGNALLHLMNIEIFAEQHQNLAEVHPYSEFSSFVYGYGSMLFESVGFFKTIRDHDVSDWGVTRTSNVTDTFYDPRFNQLYMTWNHRNLKTGQWKFYNTIFGYAGEMEGSRRRTGRPKVANIFRSTTQKIQAPEYAMTFKKWQESFIPLHDAPLTTVTFSDAWVINPDISTTPPFSNLTNMFVRSYGLWKAKYVNGIPINISSNFDPYTEDTGTASLLQKSIYLQAHKPGDLIGTTRWAANEQDVINQIGYGQWRKAYQSEGNTTSRIIVPWLRVVSLRDPACFGGCIATYSFKNSNIPTTFREGRNTGQIWTTYNTNLVTPSDAGKQITISGHNSEVASNVTYEEYVIHTWRAKHGQSYYWPDEALRIVRFWKHTFTFHLGPDYINNPNIVWYAFIRDDFTNNEDANYRTPELNEWGINIGTNTITVTVTVREYFVNSGASRKFSSGTIYLGAYYK